ncbi:MAG TPA: DUF3124 domain-containing protein [Bacteroidales bacterium]|nr:DUF3124 domain-containing protein [Bacteroidales bacterium]
MIRFIGLLLFASFFLSCAEPSERSSSQQQKGMDSTQPPSAIRDTAGQITEQSYSRHSSSMGQLLYVPVYSHIYQQDRQKTFNLTTTLSIRNADPLRSLTLVKVSYYDSQGNVVQQYVDKKQKITPQASISFVVEERDLRGGVGANFLVSWKSDKPVNPPVIQAVMISTSQQQGISFLSKGRVLQELPASQTTDS